MSTELAIDGAMSDMRLHCDEGEGREEERKRREGRGRRRLPLVQTAAATHTAMTVTRLITSQPRPTVAYTRVPSRCIVQSFRVECRCAQRLRCQSKSACTFSSASLKCLVEKRMALMRPSSWGKSFFSRVTTCFTLMGLFLANTPCGSTWS